MDDFPAKLLLSFLVGGAWIGVTTLAAERFGTKVGGIIGALPTTALVSLLFIGWSQGVEAAAQASVMVPAVMGLNTVFLLVCALSLPRGSAKALLSALSIWGLLAAILVTSRLTDIAVSTAIFLLLASSTLLSLEYGVKVKSQRLKPLRHGLRQLLYRGLLAGGVIAFAVYASRVGGAWLGGLFSAFPASYLSIIVIFGAEHGPAVGRAMVKSLVVGSGSICAFGVAVNIALGAFGLGPGIASGYVCSLGVAALLILLTRRLK